MAGLMRPVGPDGPRTYWIRRVLVLGVALVVVAAIVALVINLGGDDGTTAAPPDVPSGPSLQPAGTPTPTAPASSASGPSKSPSATAGSKTPASTGSAKSSPSRSATSPTPDKKASKKSTPPKPPACRPEDLRTTLTGPRTVSPGEKVSFRAGVINGGKDTCVFTLDPDDYVFRIYSGTDRIWTTKDCPKWLPEVEATLKSQQDVTWEITWTVQRSKGCSLVETELRPGTYAANSLLNGADPAQLVMQLK